MSYKQAIFSLIDVSGSMRYAYSKKYSNSKIESLIDTIRNVIFSDNILGSEKDIDFYSLIFGTSKIQNWLNALELFDTLKENQNIIENIKSDPKYKCDNPQKKIIELLENEGAIDIDRYIKKLPSDYLHVLLYYIKNDKLLLKEIYERLPNCHKKTKSIFFSFGNSICRGVGGLMNFDEEIKEHYDFVYNKVKGKIIEEKIDKKEIKEIIGDSIYNLRKKLSSFLDSSSKNRYLNEIESIIYGYTPMNKVFNDLFNFINNNNFLYKNKVIFLLSDGESTDGNPKDNVIEQLKNTNSHLISCFLSSESQNCPKKIYDENDKINNLTKGEKILFEMSSIISSTNPFFDYLEEKGWEIPKNGKCKLFLRVNDPNILNEYLSIITSLVKENDVLFDLIGKINFQQYITDNINNFEPKQQEGPTCYAHSIATVIHMCLNKIFNKDIPSFEDIRNDIIDNYEECKGIKKILKKVLPKYKLNYKEINEKEAKYAIQKGRPCLFSFLLNKRGWE